jgi:predicted LPLAT superfamily acyltransferase
MSALQARSHLGELEVERALAKSTALAGVDSYMADLDEEIATWRNVYIGAAVTEIASLRAELFGPQYG